MIIYDGHVTRWEMRSCRLVRNCLRLVFFQSAGVSQGIKSMIGTRTSRRNAGYHYNSNFIFRSTLLNVLHK